MNHPVSLSVSLPITLFAQVFFHMETHTKRTDVSACVHALGPKEKNHTTRAALALNGDRNLRHNCVAADRTHSTSTVGLLSEP